MSSTTESNEVCRHGNTRPVLVTIPAHLSHTGRRRPAYKLVDSCIANLVRVLNEGGVITITSCCGHGKGDGQIDLEDGRILIIGKKQETKDE